MEKWDDLVKKAASERASQGKDLDKKGWSQFEAYTAQLEYWKTTLKSKVELTLMNNILEEANRELRLNGRIHMVDREKLEEGPWTGGYQGRGGYRPITAFVKYGPELTIPNAGSIGIFAGPKFDWKLMARQWGSGKTTSEYEVEGPFVKGAIGVGRTAKSMVAENIAAMIARGLIR